MVLKLAMGAPRGSRDDLGECAALETGQRQPEALHDGRTIRRVGTQLPATLGQRDSQAALVARRPATFHATAGSCLDRPNSGV